MATAVLFLASDSLLGVKFRECFCIVCQPRQKTDQRDSLLKFQNNLSNSLTIALLLGFYRPFSGVHIQFVRSSSCQGRIGSHPGKFRSDLVEWSVKLLPNNSQRAGELVTASFLV
jgi:hypothetical protein